VGMSNSLNLNSELKQKLDIGRSLTWNRMRREQFLDQAHAAANLTHPRRIFRLQFINKCKKKERTWWWDCKIGISNEYL
jgi:hypothetical protein